MDMDIYVYINFQRRQWQPTPVLVPGKSHGQRSLVGCSPWGREESDRTEWLHFHFSLSCIGEGNGNSLQCSCLEDPRDGGAWWASIYGVAQSWTQLKRLSGSSSMEASYWNNQSRIEECQSPEWPKQRHILIKLQDLKKTTKRFPSWVLSQGLECAWEGNYMKVAQESTPVQILWSLT